MSKLTGPDIRNFPKSGHQMRMDDRLIKPFLVSKKMRSFVERMRLRAKDLDLADPERAAEFESSRETMGRILKKKKISNRDAEKIIEQTLDAAADHQLERLRRDRFVHELERSRKDLRRLNKHIDHLAADFHRKNQQNYSQPGLAAFRYGNVPRASNCNAECTGDALSRTRGE